MAIIDIVILCLFIPGIIKGLKDGLIKQIAGIGSLFLGAWMAYKFSDLISTYLSRWIHAPESTVKIISFALILIIVIYFVSLIGKLVTKLFSIAALGWLNRLLGVLVACCTTLLILGLLASLIDYVNSTWFELIPKSQIAQSKLFTPISEVADFLFPYLKTFFKIN